MKTLHNKLEQEVPQYQKWHTHNAASVVHLCLLIVFATLFSQNILGALSGVSKDSFTAAVLRDASGRPDQLGRTINTSGDRILVKFRKTTNARKRLSIIADKKLTIKSQIQKIDVDVFAVNQAYTADEVVQSIKSKYKNEIEYVEVDPLVEPSAVPNDPGFSSEWDKTLVGFPAAWDTTTGSNSVIVGIADTGVDCTHGDLAQNCVPGWNFYDNNSDTSDVYGHGTAVAGVVAAVGNNGRDVAGGAWNVKIMPLRISDASGLAYGSTIANAITYAADRGVKVINNSYAVASKSSAMQSAAAYLASKGGILVTSAGNTGVNTGITFNDANFLTVSATDGSDNKYSWSAYGTDVDISAPGCTTTTARGGGTRGFCGTSNSAPEVSGLLALMYSINPNLTNETARNALFSTVLDLGAPGWDPNFGWGRIRADRAILAVSGGVISTPPPAPPTIPPPVSDTTAPSVPPGLVASGISTSEATLTWAGSTDNVGVAGYNMYRNGTKIWSGTGFSYINTGLTPATSYSYSISAYDAAGNESAKSGAVTITTGSTSDVTSPSIPQNIQGHNITTSTDYIVWGASTDNVKVTGYNLYKNNVKIWSGNATSFSDAGLTSGTRYTYSVSAFDAAGNTSEQGTAVTITTLGTPPTVPVADTSAPTIPTGLRSITVTSTQANLAWSQSNDNVGVTGYNLYRNGNKIWSGLGLSYSDTPLSPSTSYSYTISAYDSAGNVSSQSASVSVTTTAGADVTPPSIPQNIQGHNITGSSVLLVWSASSDNLGVAGYNLYQNGTKIWSGNSLSYNVTSLSQSTKYTFTVNAYDAAGNVSGESNSISVTTGAVPLQIISFSISDKTGSTATIIWSTSQSTTGSISYGTGYGNLPDQALATDGAGTSHSVTLSGLNPDSTYYYNIRATSPYSSITTSVSSFKTSVN